jgi:type IV pilus assembly protein PilC
MASLTDSNAYNSPHTSRNGGLSFRIDQRRLARMCHNVGSSLHAGVDVRRVWKTEASRGSAYYRSKMTIISDRINDGDTLTEAMRATGGFFPPLVCEMVEVGERTGRLERIFHRLGEHYDNLVRLQRMLLMGIAWPMFELTLALGVIGLFILILGWVAPSGQPPPITFMGLYGTEGLMIYCGFLCSIVAIITATFWAAKNGWVSLDPLNRVLMRVPGIGSGLQTMAISRLCWSLSLATDSDIDARHASELAIRTTQNSYYTEHIEGIKHAIRRGGDLSSAFQNTGVFPDDFLAALQTGEIGGRISEAMHVLAKEYEDRAKLFYRMVAVVAGFGVFLLVALIIIMLIFQLFSQYVGILNDAGQI